MAEKVCTISQYKFYSGTWSSWSNSLYGGYAGNTKYITVLKIIAPTISNSSSSFSITIPWVRQEWAAKEGLLYVKFYGSDPTTKSISTICSEVTKSYSDSKEWKTYDCAVHTTTFTFDTTSISSNGTFYIAIGCSTNFLEIGYSSSYVDKYSAKVKYTDTYTVSYNANGGSGAPSAQIKTHGVTLTLSSTKPTKASTVTNPTGTITVSYNANGGSSTPDNGTGQYTNTKTVPYTFKNWNTASNGTGTSYNSGGSYTANAIATLYAQWTTGSATETRKTNPSIKTASSITRSNGSTTGYEVTFNANEGSSTPSAVTSTRTVKYTFSKWNTNSSGTGTNYSADTSYTFSGNTTLYAKWNPSYTNNAVTLAAGITRAPKAATAYTVTLNANGGSCSTTSLSAARTTSYTFAGWNTNSSGTGTNYSASSSYTPSAAVTLYAKWNSSTSTAAITLPTPKRSGHTFKGWSTSSTSTSGSTGSYIPSGSVTLYAVWEKNKYPITYNKNGATGTKPEDQQKVHGESISLRDKGNLAFASSVTTITTTLNLDGGKYNNSTSNVSLFSTKTITYPIIWNTKADGTGTDYTPGSSYTTNAALNLYAKKGSGSSSYTSVTLPTPIRTGYTFDGWKIGSNVSLYSGGTSYTPTSNTTFVAQWTQKTYKIEYDANEGQNAPGHQIKIYGTDLYLRSSSGLSRAATKPANYTVRLNLNGGSYPSNSTTLTAVRTAAYTPLYWNTKGDNSGTKYAFGAKYTDNSSVTLFAQWQYSTTTDAVNLQNASKIGHTFSGWYTGNTDGVKVYTPYVPDTNKTLYARYKVNTYSVSYDANTGDGSMSPSSINYGSSFTPSKNSFTKRGYQFIGWNEKANGSGVSWNPSSSKQYTYTNNITLYAQWAPIEYTIKYDLKDGATDKPTTITVKYDEANVSIIKSKDVHKDKYDFKGWTTNPNGTPDGYTWSQWGGDSGATWCFINGEYGIVNNTLNLYAIWEPSPFIITYSIYNDSYVNNQKVNKNSKLLSITEVMSKSGIKLKDYDKYVTWVTSGGIEVDWDIIDFNASGTVSPRPYTVYAKIEPRFKIVYKDIGNWKRLTPKLYRNGKWITPKINITK